MSTMTTKVTGTAGVVEKVVSPDYSDPKFAVFQGSLGSHSRTIDEVVVNTAGVNVGVANRTKEGLGTGGFDRFFAVYNG